MPGIPWYSPFGLLLVAVVFMSADVATAGELRVGAAAVNLQADDSMVIGGSIGPKWAKGQEGQLRAVAVVIEKPGAGKVAIVACDVLFTPRSIVDPALAMIEKTVAIPPSHVLVSATHTHHAPSTAKLHGYGPQEKFCKCLVEGIVRAVQQANARLPDGESDFFFHLGEEKTVGANSRLLMKDGRIHWIGPRDDAVKPTGPFDPQLPVLAFQGSDRQRRAVLFNHSTHTIGTLKGSVRSPSFYGLAAQQLGAKQNTVVGFLQGASGSTHNLYVPADEAVRRIEEAVSAGLKNATRQRVDRVYSAKRPFMFKVRNFDEAVEDEKVVTYVRKYAPHIADKTIRVFREMRRELRPQQGQDRETVIQVIAIGDVAIVGVPAEYFTSLGIDIKQRSPFGHTLVAELANDWIGYLPDRESHRLGGYQTWTGLHSYAEVGTGERMADEVVNMLQSAKQHAGQSRAE